MQSEGVFDLVTRVQHRAQHMPNEVAFVFARRRESDTRHLTWSQLWQQAARIAYALPSPAGPDPFGVLLFCRDEALFIPSLLATWIKGGVAIPGSGSVNRHIVERNAHVLDTAQPEIILHDLSNADLEKLRPFAGAAQFLHVESLLLEHHTSEPVNLVGGGGLLQFTSGTTSKPKAIRLTHQAISHNCSAIMQAYDLSEQSIGVHWLPLYHDMGLLGGVITTLSKGGLSVLLQPFQFIQDPMSWFKAISHWRGTITSAPNFAYARLLEAARETPPEDLDLSCLKNVVVGSEPVQKGTLDGLIECFGPAGLSADALAPSYGLAEATLLACNGKRIGGPSFAKITGGRDIASLGPPIDGLTIDIMNDDHHCNDDETGNIVVSGASVGHVVPFGTDWRLGQFSGPADPVSPGDFGFRREGEIYITGRKANKIIVRGKNVFAEDVEAIAAQAVPRAVPSGLVAFAIAQDDTEALCLVIEVPQKGPFDELINLNSNVGSKLGVKLSRVVVLRGPCLPRTSSGKIKRSETRQLLLSGALDRRIQEDVRQSDH